MDNTIDSLSIQISTDASRAEKGLKDLSDTLGRLRDATKGGLGLTSIANQVKKLGDATEGINDTKIQNLKNLADAIKALSGLNDIKISASIANQLTKINTALAGLNIGDGEGKIRDLVTALQPLETLGKSSLSTTVNALNKLPEAMAKIDTRKLHSQITALTRIMQPLADEMQKIANGFNAFPSRIQRLIQENERLSTSNRKVSTSYTEMYSKLRMAYSAVKVAANTIGKLIYKSAQYNEIVNRFNVAMGEYAREHYEYAQQLNKTVGIDIAEWMDYESTLMMIATGFGIARDRAAKMSKQMTQLGYDIKAFTDNISVEEAMLKIQSGFAGELEPLRRIGYDLSQARLQQEAYTLGINKKVSAMTQAEKAELRYYAIMTQVTGSHGEMAKQINEPANQLALFKSQVQQAGRAIGSIFIPILNLVLPYLIAFAKIVRLCAEGIAHLFGYELPEVKDWDGLTSGVDDYSSALDGAADSAKKLKQYTMGFDELNVIDPNKGSGSDSGNGIGGSGFDFELPEYDFLEKFTGSRVEEILTNLKLTIGDVFTDWKDLTGEQIAKKIVTGLMALGGAAIGFAMGGIGGAVLGIAIGAGLGLLVSAIDIDNDGELSAEEITKLVEDSLLWAGSAIGLKLGGWKGGILAFTIGLSLELGIKSIKAIMEEGATPQNITTLILSVLGSVGGIIGAFKLFNKNHKNPIPDMETATKTIDDVSTGTSKVTGTLKTLATNLAWGTLIIAEVTIAAGIIIGSIWGLGWMLEQIGIAWQPVIDDGGTVAIAVGIGTAILVAVGLSTYGLGTLGAPVAGQIGIGMGILAEIGIATGLFLAEIWGIGKLLDEIGQAWEPVLDDGEDIATAIDLGTALLIGVGVVTAALGAATVASAGSLPIAIGLGTALLLELGVAFGLFCDELIKVADKLSDDLHPALKDLTKVLPDLNTEMDSFTKLMKKFAKMTVDYTKNSAISGFAATVDSIIGFFTKDPIKALADDVNKQYEQSQTLNEKLCLANPELSDAITNLSTYKTRIDELKTVADTIDTSEVTINGFTNLVTVSSKIASFGKELKAYHNYIKNIAIEKMDNIVNCVNDIIDFAVRIKNEVDTTAIDNFTKAIERLTKSVEDLPTSKTLTIRAIYKTSGNAPQQFATGGYPETGQMFIAREAGAELVGNIGRKTAVVNNEQIVASVSRGVAEANSEQNTLLREQNTLLRALLEKESGVYLDGKKLTNSVEKYQKQRGKVLVTGGAY